MIRWIVGCLLTWALSVPIYAQLPAPVAAPAEPASIPLYPDTSAGSIATERWARFGTDLIVRNVTRPTLTPYLPKPKKATGAAVVIVPGGAYLWLAMSQESWPVARWLSSHGIAAFVLKYRLLATEQDTHTFFQRMAREARARSSPPRLENAESIRDALTALHVVRARAKQWGIDPARVGMMGFSAGAITTLNTVLADAVAERPAFFGYIYGPQTAVTVPPRPPAMFAAIAWDDQLFPSSSFALEEAWHKAGGAVELHAYQRGGHGFGGLGRSGTTTTLMLEEFRLWLETSGWLGGGPRSGSNPT
jgi:dienelactone hydrolase